MIYFSKQIDACDDLKKVQLPAYSGVDIDDYVKMCNSAPNVELTCSVLQSFALLADMSVDDITDKINCCKYKMIC